VCFAGCRNLVEMKPFSCSLRKKSPRTPSFSHYSAQVDFKEDEDDYVQD
jgi:hypothetical protein